MLPVGAVFAFLGRQLGKILEIAFSWATITLFGRVPPRRQLILSAMALAALAWPIAILGVLVPSVATFLFALVTVPSWVEGWLRLAMLVAAVILPALIGVGSRYLTDDTRGRGGIAGSALRGYPTAVALCVVLLWMMVLAPVSNVRAIVRRWTSAHVPIAIKPGRYEVVVRDIGSAAQRAGVPLVRREAGWAYELPGHILAALGGPRVRGFVPKRLVKLVRADLEIVVHPMDLAVSGQQKAVSRARAAIARELTFTEAYQTWDPEAQKIEDRLARAARGEEDLAPIGQRIEELALDFDQWEVLYRLLLQVRLRRDPLESDSVTPEYDAPPPIGQRLRGLRIAFRHLWPPRRAHRGAERTAA